MKLIPLVLICLLLLVSCQTETAESKAARIHDKVLTVDTHCDTPMMLFSKGFDPGKRNENGRVDFVRMKEGGMDAMFFAAFLGQGPRTADGNERAKIKVFEIIDSVYAAVERYSDLAEICTTPDDAYRAEQEGKRAIYLGMENGYPVGNDLNLIQSYYDRGVRYITLCHTANNDICDSSTDRKGSEYNGLSSFGESVLNEMNRLGMIIDVSHISDSSFYDVIRLSNAPVIASHSCARSLCDNPRNMDDDMLNKLAENGGVIQMCILSDYVKTPEPYPARDSAFAVLREKFHNYEEMTEDEKQVARSEWSELGKKYPRKLANVSDVVNHIDHIVKVAGIDHVGIGTDFDGGGGVEGCEDVSQMGNITLELVKRGYTEKEIEKIWGGNFMRVFREVQDQAEENS
ncbi:MAG: dipeptidase [Bacteroidales bacterium]|nr:dipeptidase [Bacteroidales bacterium]